MLVDQFTERNAHGFFHVARPLDVAGNAEQRGASWFAGIGRPNNTGTKLFCISGHVNRPGVYEAWLGIPARRFIEEQGGGIAGGRARRRRARSGGAEFLTLQNETDQ